MPQPPAAERSFVPIATAVRLGVMGLGWVAACGAPGAPPDLSTSGSAGFEGPNFYEPPASEAARAPSTPPVPSSAPGFFGFVSGDDALAECALGPAGAREMEVEDDPALVCPPISRPLISDFTFAPGAPVDGVSFDGQGVLRGGTFFYPAGALTSEVTENDWHISGTVSSVAGFGLYLQGCRQLDASPFGGIAFSVRGQIGAGGGLVFFIGTAQNQVSHRWLNENDPSLNEPEPPNLGRCIPLSSRYDGSCREARLALDVTDEPVQHALLWREFRGGCPADSVDPSEITAIAWFFPEVPSGPYSVDIHLDDLRFADLSPL